MDKSFWAERWNEGRIGFHQAKTNPHLVKWLDRASEGRPARVLVPLAGKSNDMTYLASKGQQVVGVEIVELAVEAFFRENGLAPARTTVGEFAKYEAGGVELFCGDFFALRPEDAGTIGWAYDRAALIALPADVRPAYAKHLMSFVGPGGRVLLVTCAYDPSRVDGPPFSISDAHVHELYDALAHVERLSVETVAFDNPRFRDAKIPEVEEAIYLLERRS